MWEVKFGDEVPAEVFATKLLSALGYYSDATHYVESGRILGARRLKRAAKHIGLAGAGMAGDYAVGACGSAWSG